MAQTINLTFAPLYELRIFVNGVGYHATWSDGLHPGHPGVTYTNGELTVNWDDTHPDLFTIDQGAGDFVLIDSR